MIGTTLKKTIKEQSKKKLKTMETQNQKETQFKNVTKRDWRKSKRVINKKSELTYKKLFGEIGIVNVDRQKRHRILRTLAKDIKL